MIPVLIHSCTTNLSSHRMFILSSCSVCRGYNCVVISALRGSCLLNTGAFLRVINVSEQLRHERRSIRYLARDRRGERRPGVAFVNSKSKFGSDAAAISFKELFFFPLID